MNKFTNIVYSSIEPDIVYIYVYIYSVSTTEFINRTMKNCLKLESNPWELGWIYHLSITSSHQPFARNGVVLFGLGD